VTSTPGEGRHPAGEHHIEVRRTARYYTLGPAPDTAREVWFVLHGYSQLARRFLRHFSRLDDGTRALVAPEALNRYYSEYEPGYHRPDARTGATWMTREDRLTEIADYINYLDQLYLTLLPPAAERSPQRLVLLGFSQGAAAAARWAAQGTARFSRIILWGGFVPSELARQPDLFHGSQLTLVCGRGDHYATPAAAHAESEALRAAGLAHRLSWYDGGHQIDATTLERLANEA